MQKHSFFNEKRFLSCCANTRHLSAFDAFRLLWGKKHWIDEISASSCIEETCGSAHACVVDDISEAERIHFFVHIATIDLFVESGRLIVV